MEGIPVSFDINGNNGNGWGNGWGALIGGAIGGAVGAGAWGGNRNNGNCGCGYVQGDQFIMDAVTSLNNNVNGLGRDQLIQACSIGSNLATGQARTEAAVYATGLQSQLSDKDNIIAILNSSHAGEVQGMRNTFDIVSSQKDCCCETNRNIERQGCDIRAAIHAEGEATRQLIEQRDREELLRKLAAKDSEIDLLKNQQGNAILAREIYQQNQRDMRDMTRLILAAVRGDTNSGDTSGATGS